MDRSYRGIAEADPLSAGRVVDAGDPDVLSMVVNEPVGVCALITP